jgi:NAD(P)-dependent dehydrogenase (short-subunit alcohol dehydrogenase family)
MTAKIPLGRYGLPVDIAAVAVFLASPEASYINGADILVDGGMTAVSWAL